MALSWCFEDESSSYGENILAQVGDLGALVPSVWPVEIANSLLRGQRRSRISEAATTTYLRMFDSLIISIDHTPLQHVFGRVLQLARAEDLSAYDASYIELALRSSLPLASLDGRMRKAATNVGLQLAGPET